MPFYVVTYTALVESEDEVGAAEKVMANLQVEPRMTFAVKLDEHSTKHISVTRQAVAADGTSTSRPADTDCFADKIGSGLEQENHAAAVSRPARSVGLIGAIVLAISFGACGLAGLFHFAWFPSF